MTIRAQRRSSSAFTLVELLVVIGIIAILVAVSFPNLRSAIAKANMVKCSGHLRSIGVALINFAGDNNGNLPVTDVSVAYNNFGPTSKKYGWTQQLEPYIGADKTVYQCPEGSQYYPSSNANYSYFLGVHAVKASGGTQGVDAVSLLKMRSTAQHIMGGDISFNSGLTDVTDADKDDWEQDPAFGNGTAANPTKIPIHLGNSNVLFADGHVEALKYFDPTSMTTSYGGVNPNNTYLNP